MLNHRPKGNDRPAADKKRQTIDGRFVPAGEVKLKTLQFSWKDRRGAAEMSCQYTVDLDNYTRLSCLWSYGGSKSGALPGFENYYPVDGRSGGGAKPVGK